MFEKYKVNDIRSVIHKDTKLVIDFDSMLFKMASSAERTQVRIIHRESGKDFGLHKNKSTFLGRSKLKVGANCLLNDINVERDQLGKIPYELDEFIVENIQTPIVGYQTMFENMYKWIDDLCAVVGIEKKNVVYLAGDSGSFRDRLALPKKYKGGRASQTKPLMLTELRNRFIEKYSPPMFADLEADDLIGIYQFKGYLSYLKTGKTDFIVSTIDKDALGTAGFIVNYDKINGDFKDPNLYMIPDSSKDIGTLVLKKNTVKGCGFKWGIVQGMLLGDGGDSFYTYHYFPELKGKYGQKQCYDELACLETPEEVLSYVRDTWLSWFPSGKVQYTDWQGKDHNVRWFEFANMTWRCAYMARNFSDKTTLMDVFDRFGVSLYAEEIQGELFEEI